jgi:ferritin-like metal-binding protein YciE
MKTQLSSLNQMLTFHLEAMYYAEKQIQKELPELILDLDSRSAVDTVSRYIESANDKRLKLKRIFGYLLAGPFRSGNGAVSMVVSECSDIMDTTGKGRYRDLLMISTLEALSEYKVTSYNTALKIALQMDLKKVAELLEDIISWEVESAQSMSDFVSQLVIESNTFTAHSSKAL